MKIIARQKKQIYANWFDSKGQLHLNPMVIDSENGILFALEWYVALDLLGMIDSLDLQRVLHLLRFYGYPNLHKFKDSHDNYTACFILAKLAKQRAPAMPKTLLHPRDVIYYNYMRGALWAKPLIFLVGITNLISCIKMYEYRPKFFEKIKWSLTGVKYKSRKDLHTDGKILVILRTYGAQSKTLSFFGYLCHLILKKRLGESYLTRLFNVYFTNQSHPNRLAWSQINGMKWWGR